MNKIFIKLLMLLVVSAVVSPAAHAADSISGLSIARLDQMISELLSYKGNDTVLIRERCDEMIRLATEAGISPQTARAWQVAGKISGRQADYNRAFRFLGTAVETARKLNTAGGREVLATSLTDLGSLHHQSGDLEAALRMYLEAESLLLRDKNQTGLIMIYTSLGDLYDKLQQPGKRELYNQMAFNLAPLTNDLTARCKAYTGMATNLANDGKFKEAIDLYNTTIDIARQTGDLHLLHTAYYDIGFTYSRAGDYKMALEMYRMSLTAALQNNNSADEGDALYKIGLSHYYLNNLTDSREFLFRALKVAEQTNSLILRRNVLDVLYSVEETAGDYKKAYNYLNRYVDVVYEIFSLEDQQQVNLLNAKFKAVARDHQIRELEAERLIHNLKLRRQQTWITGLGVILLLSFIVGFLVLRNNRYKRRIAEQQIKIKEQQLSELQKERELLTTRSVLQGEESERLRISRDLHDGLGGLLSGVKLNLSSMKGNSIITSDNAEAFEHAISLLDKSIGELRRVAHNLMPETLNHYGLKTALADFVNELGKTGNTLLNFRSFGEDMRFNSNLELTTYRIAQELVNNALKHASATTVDLQLIAEPDRVCIQVLDNGMGFDPAAAAICGKGLMAVRERVEAFNGQLEIDSKPGEGTGITVEFLVS